MGRRQLLRYERQPRSIERRPDHSGHVVHRQRPGDGYDERLLAIVELPAVHAEVPAPEVDAPESRGLGCMSMSYGRGHSSGQLKALHQEEIHDVARCCS
jgi:hypothetical protein